MSKAVMLSILPKWCAKIASGEKTIEVRKTKPKLETPFKCYIYCTQDKHLAFMQNQTGTNLIACMDVDAAISKDGAIAICPLAISAAYRHGNGACNKDNSDTCADCKRQFWSAEVE